MTEPSVLKVHHPCLQGLSAQYSRMTDDLLWDTTYIRTGGSTVDTEGTSFDTYEFTERDAYGPLWCAAYVAGHVQAQVTKLI